MTDADEQTALIKQAQNGDKGAFEALLRTHYEVMYRTAYKWCGNRPDAEDITQNACIKLARSIDGFRFQAAFSSWLYRLVINTAKDWSKARPPQTMELEFVPDRSQAAMAEIKIYAGQVMAYVRTMTERERTALHLVFSEGLTHREAAEVMECRESTVSWYIHQARKKLQSFQKLERCYG